MRLIHSQAVIERRCPELLKLGLLSDVAVHTVSTRRHQRLVSFHHKSLQEKSAARHVVKQLENSNDIQVIPTSIVFLYLNWVVYVLTALFHRYHGSAVAVLTRRFSQLELTLLF